MKTKVAGDYAKMQKEQYETTSHLMIGNHRSHDNNPDYKGILLAPIFKMKGGVALDFGCGHGRNVQNLLAEDIFDRVDGVDISANNIEYATKNIIQCGVDSSKFNLMVNTGLEASVLPSDEYSFVVSTIVLQHICCYDIRFNILKDIYRSMKQDGILSFQMGFGTDHMNTAGYFDNAFSATATNSLHDVRVENEDQIIGDLIKIGFKKENISTEIRPSFEDRHKQWIYVKVVKQ